MMDHDTNDIEKTALTMLRDKVKYPDGITLSHFMSELGLTPNQVRNYIGCSDHVTEERVRVKGEEKEGDHIGYEGFLRLNYTAIVYTYKKTQSYEGA